MGWLDSLSNGFNTLENAVNSAVGSVVGDVEGAVKAVVGEPVSLIQEGLEYAYQGLATGAEDTFDVLKDGGSFMWDALKQAPEGLLHEAEAFPRQLWGVAEGIGNDAVQGPEGMYDTLKEIL